MTSPHLDFERCYRAVSSRDARFDGQFVIAVRTTGIYCRPSCPAMTPRSENVTFLPTAAAAQHSGYRACRRCLPDAAPGSPLWNTRSDLAARAMRLISDGLVERDGVTGLGEALGYSTRQLNRVLTSELGAGPVALARAHRAHTARVLVQTTRMAMSDIAFAAGFASIRQFNDTIRDVFATTPTAMREQASRKVSPPSGGTISLRLPYRKPFDTSWIEWFLSSHAVAGVEFWDDGEFTRSLRLPHSHGVVTLRPDDGFVRAELSLDDIRDLAPAVARIRHLLDLDADPVAIDEALSGDPHLAAVVAATPGIRLPGNVDGFELLMRTMIGQQISVAAAGTHVARLVEALGDPIDSPHPAVTHLFPTAAAVAAEGHQVLSGPRKRIESIVAAADAVDTGKLVLHHGRTAEDLRSDLLELSGVGPWTADYVSMRLLAEPDIFLGTDLVVRQGAEVLGLTISENERWRPWRSYASMHLWRTALTDRKSR